MGITTMDNPEQLVAQLTESSSNKLAAPGVLNCRDGYADSSLSPATSLEF
jgi:hypothetical protein